MAEDNHLYNLMEQWVQEKKSLWRLQKNYKEDAGECDNCGEFWDKMIKDKQEHTAELIKMIKDHLNRN